MAAGSPCGGVAPNSSSSWTGFVSLAAEALEAHHPTTGDSLTLYIDELEGIEVVG